MVNPAQPTTPPLNKPSPRMDLAIAARWEELLPWCILDAKRSSDPAESLHMLKTRHHARCVELLCHRISWLTIRFCELDHPRWHDGEFRQSLKEAVERRRTRMDRRKGPSINANKS